MQCNKVERLRVGDTKIWQIEGQAPFFYQAGIAIDADGAPRAYHPAPHSDLGLDSLANAGSPGNWYGIITDSGHSNGNPIIQGANDPAPGFYVSATSLQETTKDRANPLRYVDATRIPYIVLPSAVRRSLNAQLGDMAVVINTMNRRLSGAIFADIGPKGRIGEGSIALADNLGIPSSPRNGGIGSGVIYIVFPGSGNGKARNPDDIATEADGLFQAMGGMTQIQACFPDLLS
jgi:Fungal chitosanase of glycosyl hydrolase group 75